MNLELKKYVLELKHTFTISRESHDTQDTLIASLSLNGHTGYGESTSNPYYKISFESMQNEIEATTDQIVELENQIAASQRKIDEKIGEILETVHKIEELEDEILTIEAEMELTKREIEEKEIEIAGLVENQERRVEILKTRARALQNKIAPILSLILF